MTAFWEIHEIILQVADGLKCHRLKAFESSKTSSGFGLRGSVSLKKIILAGSFVRKHKSNTQRNVPKNSPVMRDLAALRGTLQELHGEYCDCEVPRNLVATALAQVDGGFKVETLTKSQTLLKLLREKNAKRFHAAAQQMTGLLFQGNNNKKAILPTADLPHANKS